MSQSSPHCPPRRRTWRFALLAAALTGGLALLIWTKLRLVTGVPKTAYADPDKDAGPESSKVRVPHSPK